MEFHKKINTSFKWRTLNTFSVLFLNGIFIIILSRLLKKETHGVFVILNTITVLSLLLTESGIGSSLVQNQKLNKYHIGSGNILAISLSLLFFLLFVIFSNNLVQFFDNKFTYWNVVILSLNIVFNAIKSISLSLLIKKFEFKKIFITQLISIIIGNFLVGVPLAYYGYGIWSFIIATTLMNFIFGLTLRILTPESLVLKFKIKELKEIISFGFPATGVQLLTFTNKQLDKLILGKLLPLSSIALYEKAFYVSNLPSKLIGDSVDSPLFSYLSRNYGNKENQFDVVFRFFQVLIVLSLLATILLFSFSKQIILILLGKNWLEASSILEIFSISIPFLIVIKLIDILARSNFKLNYSFYAKGWFNIMLIISMFYGYKQGIEYISMLITICIVIYSIIMIFVGIKIFNLKKHEYRFCWYPNIKAILFLFLLQIMLVIIFKQYKMYLLIVVILLNLFFIYSQFKSVKRFLKLKQ